MKTIIAGSREGATMRDVKTAIAECGWEITTVISGCAPGVDRLGEQWATENGIYVSRYPADWEAGPKAGYIRNRMMAEAADALVAVWDGQSRGTDHMIRMAMNRGLLISVHRFI